MSARLRLSEGQALHTSRDSSVHVHTTLAFKLLVGLEQPVTVRGAFGCVRGRAVLVPPMVAQTTETRGTALGLFVDPYVHAPIATHARYAAPMPVALPSRETARLVHLANAAEKEGHDHVEDFTAALRAELGQDARVRRDWRVDLALAQLRAAPNTPIEELGRRTRLSTERLRHLVASQTRAPLRAHRTFQRTLWAVELMMAGTPIARAAVMAGFADHAHLTRSFRRVFARTPSEVPMDAKMLAPWATRGT